MEKKDVIKYPIQQLDAYSVETLDQLVGSFEAPSFQSHNNTRIILSPIESSETLTVFSGLAGTVVPADQMRNGYEIAQVKLRSETTGTLSAGSDVPRDCVRQPKSLPGTMGSRDGDGCARATRITTQNPKRGGLSGCTCEDAQFCGTTIKNAHMAAVYRQCSRIVARCGRVFTIQ